LAVNSPRGTSDIFGQDIFYRDFVIDRVRELFKIFNFEEIITPAFEYTEVFSRSIGEATDIVKKEMYTFCDRKGRSLTLRPEGTAAVVRAVIEKKMLDSKSLPLRLFYIGNMFRYERPQKGRMREFWQVGVEALGRKDPLIDAEIIWLLNEIFTRIGFRNLVLNINSMGCGKCREKYTEKLKEYLGEVFNSLCTDCQRRFAENPLRIFDCKIDNCRKIAAKGPKISDFLCGECSDHFMEVRSALTGLSIRYTIADDLVRGFDYYTGTIFEINSKDLESAQNALGGGGRYDNLLSEFGGPDMPAIGFALGLDRTVMLMKELGMQYIPAEKRLKIYILPAAGLDKPYFINILKVLRDAGMTCDIDYGMNSIGAGIKRASKKGFDLALIIGEDEIEKGTVAVKELKSYRQYDLGCKDVVEKIMEITGVK